MNEKQYEYKLYHRIINKNKTTSGWTCDGVRDIESVKWKIKSEREYLASCKRIEFRIERREAMPWVEVLLDEILKDTQKKEVANG